MRIRRLILAAAFCAAAAAPARAAPHPRELKSYDFDATSHLPRVRPIPPWLLQAWSDADGRRYEDYAPSAKEAETLAAAFAALPAKMRAVLSERLIGVYLVKGLKGNGITDWTLDPSGRVYVYIILNPAGFKQTLSELMTERDLTLFRGGRAEVKVEAGVRPGIIYTVAHESAHAFDYVKGVTPYTEPGMHFTLYPKAKEVKNWDVWAGYDKPKPDADYPLRDKLRFYGFGDPEFDATQAASLCSQWARGPFASFYGSRSWAEDLAELFVLRHLTEDLKQPLRRVCAGKTYVPWDDPKVRARAERLTAAFYP